MNTREALRRIRLIYYSSMLLAVIVLSSSPAVAQTCEKLAELKLANTTITAAQPVAPGTFTTPGSTAAYKDLSSFCRVTGVIKPTADSDIKFEVWMPAAGWNGKFQGIGNGGFAGSISYGGLAAAVARGYASVDRHRSHHQ